MPGTRPGMTVKRNTSYQRFGRRRLKRPLHSALEPLQRLGDLGFARHRLLALFAFALDHLFRRRATKLGLPSFASTRLMSASAFCISLSSRARSAARSMTPLSGSAATSPRTRSCTEPCGGAVGEGDVGDAREPLDEFRPASARALVSADAPASTSGIGVAAMFISARTERIAVTRSISQPISASALASSRPSCVGQAPSASNASRFGRSRR